MKRYRSCMFLIIVFMEFPSGSMHKMTGCLSFIMFGLVWYGVWLMSYGMVWFVKYGKALWDHWLCATANFQT